MSELGERGSPTAEIFNFFGVLPTGILLVVFGLGLAKAYRSELLLKVSGILIAAHGVCRAAAAVFPCDAGCRPVSPSLSQMAHNAAATVGLIALTAALFIVGAWLIKRREQVATIVLTYVLGMSAVGAQVLLLFGTAGTTGLYQRIALGSLQLWVTVFAVHVYKQSARSRRNAA